MEKRYIFKSWNENWDYDYDIQGESFRKLIEACGKYCEYVSFWYWDRKADKSQRYSDFAPFWVKAPEWGKRKFQLLDSILPENMKDQSILYDLYGADTYRRRVCFYKVCPELLKTMLKISDKMFTWLDGSDCSNPEDPTFYRSDGSVFLDTVVHDSQCVLSPREGEDVKAILSAETWEEYDGAFPLQIFCDAWCFPESV